MVLRCARDDRRSRQLITFSPEGRPPADTTGEHMRKERTVLSAAYGILAMVPVALGFRWVRDGAAMTAKRPGPIAESHSASGELATMIKRLRARREQRRREQREFKAWLEITAKPLW